MTVSAIMPTIFARGGRIVWARLEKTEIRGVAAWNRVPSTSVSTGRRVWPSSMTTGMASPSPSESILTKSISMGSIVGQLSRIVPNSPSRTGVN